MGKCYDTNAPRITLNDNIQSDETHERAAAIDLHFPVIYETTFEQDSHIDVADGHAGSICITAEKIVATNTPWKY